MGNWSLLDLALIAWFALREAKRKNLIFFEEAFSFEESSLTLMCKVQRFSALFAPCFLWGVAFDVYISIRVGIFEDRSLFLSLFAVIGILTVFVVVSVFTSFFTYAGVRQRVMRSIVNGGRIVWQAISWHLLTIRFYFLNAGKKGKM